MNRTFDLDDPNAPPVELGDRLVVEQLRSVAIRVLTDPQSVAEELAADLAEKLAERGIETFDPPQLAGELSPVRGLWTGSGNTFLVHVELEVSGFHSGEPTETAASVNAALLWALGLVVVLFVGGWIVEQTTELVKSTESLRALGGEGPFDALVALAVAGVLIAGFYLVSRVRRT